MYRSRKPLQSNCRASLLLRFRPSKTSLSQSVLESGLEGLSILHHLLGKLIVFDLVRHRNWVEHLAGF